MAWMLGAGHRGRPPSALAPWARGHAPGPWWSAIWARPMPPPPRC